MVIHSFISLAYSSMFLCNFIYFSFLGSLFLDFLIFIFLVCFSSSLTVFRISSFGSPLLLACFIACYPSVMSSFLISLFLSCFSPFFPSALLAYLPFVLSYLILYNFPLFLLSDICKRNFRATRHVQFNYYCMIGGKASVI